MKCILSSLAVLTASPALAHSGVHMHPHASGPTWLPLLLAGLAIASTGVLIAVRFK